jgi:glyoxylase-like metal-dependent hydrolase (beta-lactamase superfamily II)
VILPDAWAIIGDLLMGGLVRRRTPHLPLFAKDLLQVKESMRKILGLSPKIIHPSHGGPFTREAVEMLIGKMVRK